MNETKMCVIAGALVCTNYTHSLTHTLFKVIKRDVFLSKLHSTHICVYVQQLLHLFL